MERVLKEWDQGRAQKTKLSPQVYTSTTDQPDQQAERASALLAKVNAYIKKSQDIPIQNTSNIPSPFILNESRRKKKITEMSRQKFTQKTDGARPLKEISLQSVPVVRNPNLKNGPAAYRTYQTTHPGKENIYSFNNYQKMFDTVMNTTKSKSYLPRTNGLKSQELRVSSKKISSDINSIQFLMPSP
jgi:hypothetical protein